MVNVGDRIAPASFSETIPLWASPGRETRRTGPAGVSGVAVLIPKADPVTNQFFNPPLAKSAKTSYRDAVLSGRLMRAVIRCRANAPAFSRRSLAEAPINS